MTAYLNEVFQTGPPKRIMRIPHGLYFMSPHSVQIHLATLCDLVADNCRQVSQPDK